MLAGLFVVRLLKQEKRSCLTEVSTWKHVKPTSFALESGASHIHVYPSVCLGHHRDVISSRQSLVLNSTIFIQRFRVERFRLLVSFRCRSKTRQRESCANICFVPIPAFAVLAPFAVYNTPTLHLFVCPRLETIYSSSRGYNLHPSGSSTSQSSCSKRA